MGWSLNELLPQKQSLATATRWYVPKRRVGRVIANCFRTRTRGERDLLKIVLSIGCAMFSATTFAETSDITDVCTK